MCFRFVFCSLRWSSLFFFSSSQTRIVVTILPHFITVRQHDSMSMFRHGSLLTFLAVFFHLRLFFCTWARKWKQTGNGDGEIQACCLSLYWFDPMSYPSADPNETIDNTNDTFDAVRVYTSQCTAQFVSPRWHTPRCLFPIPLLGLHVESWVLVTLCTVESLDLFGVCRWLTYFCCLLFRHLFFSRFLTSRSRSLFCLYAHI